MSERTFILSERCPACGAALRVQRRRVDRERFIGCSAYPRCKFVEDFDERMQRVLAELKKAQEWASLNFAAARGKQPPQLNVSAIDSKLRELIFQLHPDRSRGVVDGTSVVAALNDLRSTLKRAA